MNKRIYMIVLTSVTAGCILLGTVRNLSTHHRSGILSFAEPEDMWDFDDWDDRFEHDSDEPEGQRPDLNDGRGAHRGPSDGSRDNGSRHGGSPDGGSGGHRGGSHDGRSPGHDRREGTAPDREHRPGSGGSFDRDDDRFDRDDNDDDRFDQDDDD